MAQTKEASAAKQKVYIREALDQVILVGDLAALVLGVLLQGSKVVGGGAVLCSDLGRRGVSGVKQGGIVARGSPGSGWRTYNVARHLG